MIILYYFIYTSSTNKSSHSVGWLRSDSMKKQPEVTEATRKAFIDAFSKFYREKPIEKITIQEITREAGYNRSTFYQYFKDVYDLLEYVEGIVIKGVSENIVSKVVYGDIGNTIIESFTQVEKDKKVYLEMLLGNTNSSRFIENLKNEIIPVFINHFKISPGDIKSRYVLEFYLSGIIAMSRYWLKSGQDIPIEDFHELLHGLFVEGVQKTLEKNIEAN